METTWLGLVVPQKLMELFLRICMINIDILKIFFDGSWEYIYFSKSSLIFFIIIFCVSYSVK